MYFPHSKVLFLLTFSLWCSSFVLMEEDALEKEVPLQEEVVENKKEVEGYHFPLDNTSDALEKEVPVHEDDVESRKGVGNYSFLPDNASGENDSADFTHMDTAIKVKGGEIGKFTNKVTNKDTKIFTKRGGYRVVRPHNETKSSTNGIWILFLVVGILFVSVVVFFGAYLCFNHRKKTKSIN